MKILGFCLMVSLMIANVSYSDMYLAIDPTTNEILSCSDRDDFISIELDGENKLKEDLEYIKLKGGPEDYPLQYKPTFYKYKNNRFVVNVEKLSNVSISEDNGLKKEKEIEKLTNKIKLIALKQLKLEGETFKYIKESDFGGTDGE